MNTKKGAQQFAFENEPPAKYRLKEEEIGAAGGEETKEDEDFLQDPKDFRFDHRSSIKTAPKK